VDELAVKLPKLPGVSDQFTGRLAESVITLFTLADAAEGVITSPLLATAADPVPVTAKTLGDPG
jgi:hypothetical protein